MLAWLDTPDLRSYSLEVSPFVFHSMNRNDTRRLKLWLFLRRQCKRLMMASLLAAATWAAIPLAIPGVADSQALELACRSTPGCDVMHLCPGWRSQGTWNTADWRPRVDVCLTGPGLTGTVELPPGSIKQWLPAWLRPLVADTNHAQWTQQ